MARTAGKDRKALTLLAILVSLGSLASTGCQELEARRLVQKADALYLEGRADQAIDLYEEALAKKPELLVGRHNAALAYYQLFKPGNEDEKNLAYAKKATEHFELYLKAEPKDSDIQKLLTQTWEDSGQVDAAVKFWTEKLDADPKNRDVLNQLAAVNINAGRIQAGLDWLWKLSDAEAETAGKVQAYLTIGRTTMGRLARTNLVDMERLELADQGIAALQAALALQPDDLQIHGLLNAIYQRRSVAHGASWAQLLDLAAARSHWIQYRDLEAKAKQASEAKKADADKVEAKDADKEPKK